LPPLSRHGQWLRRHNKRKTINKSRTSYGLKHVAARDIGYITNGVFIAAAVAEDFRVVRIRESPNAWLNVESDRVRGSKRQERADG
jgi:hypothetical protein